MMAGLTLPMLLIVTLMYGSKLLLSGFILPHVIFGYFFTDIIICIVDSVRSR